MHATLCFLSYNRLESLRRAITSAVDNAHWPVEVVVHDDGSAPETQDALFCAFQRGDLPISRLILNPPGHNEGVGAAFNRCAAASSGEYVVKLDQDLTFEPLWLHRAIDVMVFNPRVGAVGLFKYPVEPVRWQDMEVPGSHETAGTRYHYVRDFVSSALVTDRTVLQEVGPWPEHSEAFAEDVEWKRLVQEASYELALPDDDLATNHGFGVGPSTVVPAHGQVAKINHESRVFGA